MKCLTKDFTLREIASLLDLAENLALSNNQAKCTLIPLQHAILLAIKLSLSTILSSRKLKYIIDFLS